MPKSWLKHKELREDRYGRGMRFKKGSQARSRTKVHRQGAEQKYTGKEQNKRRLKS
jgi:hypothetical protein